MEKHSLQVCIWRIDTMTDTTTLFSSQSDEYLQQRSFIEWFCGWQHFLCSLLDDINGKLIDLGEL